MSAPDLMSAALGALAVLPADHPAAVELRAALAPLEPLRAEYEAAVTAWYNLPDAAPGEQDAYDRKERAWDALVGAMVRP